LATWRTIYVDPDIFVPRCRVSLMSWQQSEGHFMMSSSPSSLLLSIMVTMRGCYSKCCYHATTGKNLYADGQNLSRWLCIGAVGLDPDIFLFSRDLIRLQSCWFRYFLFYRLFSFAKTIKW
jgi:hypothetical protein